MQVRPKEGIPLSDYRWIASFSETEHKIYQLRLDAPEKTVSVREIQGHFRETNTLQKPQ